MIRFLVSASILAAMIGAAEAAPKCAPGKIYRISKKVCVDKTTAVRSGIISARQKASANRKAARAALVAKRKLDAVRVAKAPASQTPQAPPAPVQDESERVTRTIILPPVTKATGSTSSPFGSLVDPWRSGSLNAYPEMQFSLRSTTDD